MKKYTGKIDNYSMSILRNFLSRLYHLRLINHRTKLEANIKLWPKLDVNANFP